MVLLLATVRLNPTMSQANKVMVTEVAAKALEVCGRRMIRGSADSQHYDNVVGTLAFVLVVNSPSPKE